MSLSLEKVVKAKWTCDWCESYTVTNSENMPANWTEGEGCHGNHFCSDNCYILSRNTWEDGFEDAMSAQCKYYEREREKWLSENGG